MFKPPTYHLDLAATNWQIPVQFPALVAGEVHVWRLPLVANKKELARLASLLSAQELTYAQQSYFTQGYQERVLSRAGLRILLSRYLQQTPSDLDLKKTAKEKPFLTNFPNLHFNVSHSGEHALFAFTRIAPIGVDLEKIDPTINVLSLVNRFFSRVEVPVILETTAADQASFFFRAWTRKEAVIKATGNGLSTPLHEFGVSIELSEPVRVLHTDWQPQEAAEWALRSFTVRNDLPGALALKGDVQRVVYLDSPCPSHFISSMNDGQLN